MTTFSYIWEFTVNPAYQAQFEAAYGPHGDWVKLFKRDPAYIRTDLHRDLNNPQRFICVGHWQSRRACMSFREHFRKEYDTIDKRCESFTVSERHLGDFDVLA